MLHTRVDTRPTFLLTTRSFSFVPSTAAPQRLFDINDPDMKDPLFGDDVAVTHGWRSKRRVLIEEDDIPHTVRPVTCDGATVYTIGTAHLAAESRDHCIQIIKAAQPDVLVLEVPPDVQHILYQTEEEAREENKTSFKDVMKFVSRIGRGGFKWFKEKVIMNHFLKTLDVSKLHEFRAAYNASKKVPGCKVMLADRTTTVTEARIEMPLNEDAFGSGSSQSNSNDTLKDYREKFLCLDATRKDTNHFMSQLPGRSRVLVTERDQMMAYAIQRACKRPNDWPSDCPPIVVAIMGIGHQDGVLKCLGRVKTIEPLLRAIPDNKGATPATYKVSDILLPAENTKKNVKGKAKSRRK